MNKIIVKKKPGTISIKEMQKLAMQHGGMCLSNSYINSKTKLWWQCAKGHCWQSTPFSIKVRKSWCPYCAGNQPLGVNAMHVLARERGGKYLSKEYKNCKTKMLWQCKHGHRFQSTLDNIKQGRWCPHCRAVGV
ncbi:zinc-ribbon domain-containing protein [Prolixibacter sp. SD074]|uniref:zinc-ribbon domain-containing protein n=1 Tax=Prolixibacter sp. SD074 TaxID=2652391 RepID=UPI00129918FE|nr:zinc-ribbon domain-containing protein [Prolixibacter sp. SD074]